MTAVHAYPPQLAAFVLDHWPEAVPLGLSDLELEELLSCCFQASLMREEERPVRFRLLLADPAALPEGGEPPGGLLPLVFRNRRQFVPDEVRRLSPAAPFETSLIGVWRGEAGLRVWGVAQSGTGWRASDWGGRVTSRGQPQGLVVHVIGPGRLVVYAGGTLVASLERGELQDITTDVFSSTWLPALFAESRSELTDLHESTREPQRASVDDSLIRVVSQHMVKRALALIRAARHGGLLLFVETGEGERYLRGEGAVRLKYGLADAEPRRRYRTLIRRLMHALSSCPTRDDGKVGWEAFQRTDQPLVEQTERAIFELSRLIAGLAAVDGAVVLRADRLRGRGER